MGLTFDRDRQMLWRRIMAPQVKDYVLRAMADDYEDFNAVFDETSKLASELGRSVTKPEVIEILESVINEGLAQAYKLSSASPWTTPVDFNKGNIEQLWFYVTPQGKQYIGGLAHPSPHPE